MRNAGIKDFRLIWRKNKHSKRRSWGRGGEGRGGGGKHIYIYIYMGVEDDVGMDRL